MKASWAEILFSDKLLRGRRAGSSRFPVSDALFCLTVWPLRFSFSFFSILSFFFVSSWPLLDTQNYVHTAQRPGSLSWCRWGHEEQMEVFFSVRGDFSKQLTHSVLPLIVAWRYEKVRKVILVLPARQWVSDLISALDPNPREHTHSHTLPTEEEQVEEHCAVWNKEFMTGFWGSDSREIDMQQLV